MYGDSDGLHREGRPAGRHDMYGVVYCVDDDEPSRSSTTLRSPDISVPHGHPFITRPLAEDGEHHSYIISSAHGVSALCVIHALPRGNSRRLIYRVPSDRFKCFLPDTLLHVLVCSAFAMSTKIITYDELKANSTKDSLYVLIHEKGASVSQQPMRSCAFITYPNRSVQCHKIY